MQIASSPSKSYVSMGHSPVEERSGYFSVVDSSAPRMPGARRFDRGGYDSGPGPGQYDSKATGRNGAVSIPRAGRFNGMRGDGTPGPAAYNSEAKHDSKGVVIGRAGRGSLGGGDAATGEHVGPGSYDNDRVTSMSPRRGSVGGTFGRAKRVSRGSDTTPGPGFYTPPSVTTSRPQGGSFSRASRSGTFSANGATPGSGSYNANVSSFTPRGGSIARTGRMASRHDGSPGPGSYNPLHAASSGNMKLR